MDAADVQECGRVGGLQKQYVCISEDVVLCQTGSAD